MNPVRFIPLCLLAALTSCYLSSKTDDVIVFVDEDNENLFEAFFQEAIAKKPLQCDSIMFNIVSYSFLTDTLLSLEVVPYPVMYADEVVCVDDLVCVDEGYDYVRQSILNYKGYVLGVIYINDPPSGLFATITENKKYRNHLEKDVFRVDGRDCLRHYYRLYRVTEGQLYELNQWPFPDPEYEDSDFISDDLFQ